MYLCNSRVHIPTMANKDTWIDTNEKGQSYYRNFSCVLQPNESVPNHLRNAPFGLGVSMFDLGKQPELMQSLKSDPCLLQTVSDLIAHALPLDCPRTCRVQLGSQIDDELPALACNIDNSNLSMLVWGHDPDACRTTQVELENCILNGDELEEPFNVLDFANSRVMTTCDEKSRAYRREIAKSATDNLASLPGVCLPDMLVSADKESVYDTLNLNHLQMNVLPNNTFKLSVDMNSGSSAIVFHSLERGSTVFLSEDETKFTMPASDGRNVMITNQAEFNQIALGDDAQALRQSMPDFQSMQLENQMKDTCLDHTDATLVSSTSAVSVQSLPSINKYTSVDSIEQTYARLKPLELAQRVQQCKSVFRLRAIATALPTMQRQNGKLAALVECDTIPKMLAFTTQSKDKIKIPNTPHWQQELINADSAKRPFKFMNNDTAVYDNNSISHYEIERQLFDQ